MRYDADNEGEEQNRTLEEILKVVEAITVWKEVPLPGRDTFVEVVDDDDDDNDQVPHIVERKRSSEATAEFAPDFLDAGEESEKVVAEVERQVNDEAPDSRYLYLVWKDGQSDELREFMQFHEKENVAFHAACVAEKAAFSENFLELYALWSDKAVSKKKTEKLTLHLAEELPARERSNRR